MSSKQCQNKEETNSVILFRVRFDLFRCLYFTIFDIRMSEYTAIICVSVCFKYLSPQ